MSTYSKKHLSRSEQVELLKSRGLLIEDSDYAEVWLKKLGYYRLSAYWYPFRKNELFFNEETREKFLIIKEEFEEKSNFKHAVELYLFDRKIRSILNAGISQIEVAVRVDIAHYMGKKNAFSYTDENLLDKKFTKCDQSGSSKYKIWLKKHEDVINRSKEEFVAYNKKKYGLPLPLWIAIEVWDFGVLSHFLSGLKPIDKDNIAERFNVKNGYVFCSWIRTLNYVRNLCAHNCRLWNRNIVDQYKTPGKDVTVFDVEVWNELDMSRIYSVICMVGYLLKEIDSTNQWFEDVKNILKEFPVIDINDKIIDVGSLGFYENLQINCLI